MWKSLPQKQTPEKAFPRIPEVERFKCRMHFVSTNEDTARFLTRHNFSQSEKEAARSGDFTSKNY
jgi:hypothetical protein